MTGFIAKRAQFRNGERHLILSRPGGLRVRAATPLPSTVPQARHSIFKW